MIGWLRRRRDARREIEAEAREYIARHGDQAYDLARERMAETALNHDWDANARWTRIRAVIRKETGHPGYRGDTATRYLEGR